MKLRGQVADVGVRLLERELLPLLEKFGKTCIILFRPDDVHFIQKAVDADGMHVTARCNQEVFFDEGAYTIQSRHRNFIAFGFDVNLLRRVLSAACRNGGEMLDMKLTMRNVPASDGGAPTPKPFLSFVTTGSAVSMAQDLPITKPLPPSQVDRLVKELESEVCPFYVDLQPEVHALQAIVDKMKPLGSALTFALTRCGSTHICMAGPSVQMGAEFRELAVLPASVKVDAEELTGGSAEEQLREALWLQYLPCTLIAGNRGGSAEERLREALRLGTASEVAVQLKHFQRCLTSSNLMQTYNTWCGVSSSRSCVHMLLTFSPMLGKGGGECDDGLELCFKVPVREGD